MTDFKWAPGSWSSMFGSSDLNSLANGSTAFSTLNSSSYTIDTTTSLELYFQAEFTGGSISPSAAADVVFFFIPMDATGASFMDGEATATVANQPIWLQMPHAPIALRSKASSTQLAMSGVVLLPPNKYRAGLLNRAGVALAASGNNVKVRLITEKGV